MLEILIRTYESEFKAGTTSYYRGNVGDKITETILFDVFWNWESSDNNLATYSEDGTYGYLERESGSWLDDNFAVGDNISVIPNKDIPVEYLYTIINVINEKKLLLNIPTPAIVGDHTKMVVSGTSIVDTVNFFLNQIENNDAENYSSLIDNSVLRLFVSGVSPIVTSWTAFDFTGFLSGYLIDSARIKGVQNVNYRQRFEIEIVYIIGPFFDSLSGIKNLLPPDYFLNEACLTDVFKIEALLDQFDINSSKGESEISLKRIGNSGWYNENFNGNLTQYSSSIAYEDVLTSDAVNELNVRQDTKIIITLTSDNGSFVNNQTFFRLNFGYIPVNDSQYKELGTKYFDNILFDSGYQGLIRKVGDASIDSDEYLLRGYGLSDVEAIYVSPSEIRIEAIYKVDSTITSLISGLDSENRNYFLIASVEDHSLSLDSSDRTTLLCDVNEFSTSVDDATLLDGTTKIYEHPANIGGIGTFDYKGWVEDGILTETDFYVDIAKDTLLDSAEVVIVAENSVTGESFDLESLQFTPNSFPYTDTYEVQITSTRGFRLNPASQFQVISFERNPASDIGTKRYYKVLYPLKLRWEDWLRQIASNYFFDSSKLNNGLNKDWVNYSMIGDWNVYFKFKADCTTDEGTTNFEIVSLIDIYDYELDAEVTPKFVGKIETLDGMVSLGVGDNAEILNDRNTQIVATFTSTDIITALESSIYGIIELEIYQSGEFAINQLSSMRTSAIGNPLIPLAGESFAKVTKVDDYNITVECDVDYTLLSGNEFKISARIGSKTNTPLFIEGKTTTTGDLKTTTTGDIKTIA